jgi:hypothetical protein
MVMWPFHRLAHAGEGWRPEGNYKTDRAVRRLADAAGLRIERVMGCGLLSARGAGLVGFDRAVRWERALARTSLARFGGLQMYVARLKTPIS